MWMRNPLAAGLTIWSRQDYLNLLFNSRLTVPRPLSFTELAFWPLHASVICHLTNPLIKSPIKLFIRCISLLLVYWSTCTCHKMVLLTQTRWSQLGLTWLNEKADIRREECLLSRQNTSEESRKEFDSVSSKKTCFAIQLLCFFKVYGRGS